MSNQRPGKFKTATIRDASGMNTVTFFKNARKLLEEYGVAGISGTSFGSFGEGYIRLSCANSDEAIEKAVSRIEKMLDNSA